MATIRCSPPEFQQSIFHLVLPTAGVLPAIYDAAILQAGQVEIHFAQYPGQRRTLDFFSNRVHVILCSTVFLHVEHAAILLDDAAVLQSVRRLLSTPASAAAEVSGTVLLFYPQSPS